MTLHRVVSWARGGARASGFVEGNSVREILGRGANERQTNAVYFHWLKISGDFRRTSAMGAWLGRAEHEASTCCRKMRHGGGRMPPSARVTSAASLCRPSPCWRGRPATSGRCSRPGDRPACVRPGRMARSINPDCPPVPLSRTLALFDKPTGATKSARRRHGDGDMCVQAGKAMLAGMKWITCGALGLAFSAGQRMPIRPSPSRWWCRSRPAARPMWFRGRLGRPCRRIWGRALSWKTSSAPAARWRPHSWRGRSPTATPF
jgi:hypothetical protein